MNWLTWTAAIAFGITGLVGFARYAHTKNISQLFVGFGLILASVGCIYLLVVG